MPKTVSMENVTGLLHGSNLKFLQIVVSSLIDMGYNTRVQVLDSSRCGGDAQKRQRVFVTASRCDLPNTIPTPLDTHSFGNIEGKLPGRTAADAIGDLLSVKPEKGTGRVSFQRIDGTYGTTYNHCEVGNDVNKVEEELNETGPARTIRRQAPVKHYALNRCITNRERARLQSFPDAFKFYGTLTDQRNQIGNAVPVRLATEVARAIKNSCYADRG